MPKLSGQPWSADDDETLLRMLAAAERRLDIASALGRSGSSISSRRIALALQGRCPLRDPHSRTTYRGSPWTEADGATLCRMLAAGESYAAIARVLKRMQTEIASKAHGLAQERETDVHGAEPRRLSAWQLRQG